MKRNIAIFASGSGTNTENIIRYFEKNDKINVVLVISNKNDAYVLKRADRFKIHSVVVPNADWKTGDKVFALLKEKDIDFIVLAGFLLKVPDILLKAYPNKIINIHPALLPKYGGKGMYGNKVHEVVVAAGEKESGITIHYIDNQFDEGKIIFQAKCAILPKDTPEDVAKKVHVLEYQYFPAIIEKVVMHSFD
ncbi:MAG: phosphoribosylglycinamide formyltransferase [Bacteroidaceae bacterium]|nr:phosphoribosylglycinamide formyltransferase [Bacteroidaceae bacterium]